MKKLKVIITLVIWFAYFTAKRLFYPMLISEAVTSQFENTAESYINLQAQVSLWQNAIGILIIITLLIFSKEIKTGISKLIKTIKEEI